MSHYVYAIVNKINLKLYFGSHSWDGAGVDPTYYGSGTIIKQAVKKYGKENFIVYPIKFYNTVEECRSAEQELLTKYDIANNIYCYNLKNGAVGWKGKTPTVAIQKDTGRVRMFLSIAECSRELTLRGDCVSACLKGKQKYAGGYTFKKINRDKRIFTVSQHSKAALNGLRGIAI